MMDKNTNYILLLDCYQALLTDKQREMMDLYYNQDFTLVEIAEEMKISRQGVYDHIKRTAHLLQQYEDKMGLLETFQRQNIIIQRMKQNITNIESHLVGNQNEEDLLRQIKQLKDLLEQLYLMSTS